MPGGFDVVPARNTAVTANAGRSNFLSVLGFMVPAGAGLALTAATASPLGVIAGAALGVVAAMAPKIARQWERAVVLRLGRYVGLKGPGPFMVIPFVDSISAWVDQRTVTTPFAAEETLTSDTVPVNVDAVLFWTVYDAEKAALEVQDYAAAVTWAAQTALRDIIGRTSLSELLRGRERIEKELQALIDERSTPWGVTVHSVEMRDVVIPTALQDAMSREAQATREKAARIILGEAEREIAVLFNQAAEMYSQNPTALQLRAMNILYEGLKQKGGALMMVPSSIVDSVGGASNLLGAAAIAQQRMANRESEDGPAAPPPQPTPSIAAFSNPPGLLP
ncbi:MAG TPA: slipin family protein [Longimicrobiaceae bacterium]|nr:slipin family protein [Longimicrobiaceae bacterium]